MKKIYALALMLVCGAAVSTAQTFTNSTTLLPASRYSGGVTGVADVDHNGLDDIIVLDQSTDLYVLYQQTDGSFIESSYGQLATDQQWGMCAGDMNNDGILDIQSGGYYDGIHFVTITGTSSGASTTQEYSAASIFMQACNFADINNDGWVDAFSCHDDGKAYITRNDGTGTMVDGNNLMDMNVYPTSDNSGNYGTTWTDFDRDGDIDLFIAKCRQVVNDPYDPRRTNVLMVNDGNNNYSDQAHERGLVNLQQSWTSDFADVDNDGDFDAFITTHSGTMELYENNGLGYFTNITTGSGLELAGFYLQGKLEDFDNDGYVDILYSGGVSGYMHNNGNKTFTAVNAVFPNSAVLHSFGVGDLNHDGWIDVYTTYGTNYVTPSNTRDRLYMNNGGANHWVTFDLTGVVSNKRAIGALVELKGGFGTQIREVRAGESYGITTSFQCHFGIGSATSVDKAIIYWPSGVIQVIENPAIDTFHSVVEITCNAPSASIQANGATGICAGQSVNLSLANSTATSYMWNTGASTSSINASQPGLYSVIAYDAQGCAAQSNQIEITQIADPAPTVSVDGDLKFCQGTSVTLTSSTGNSYLWSNGETSQSVNITNSGEYTVTVGGQCGNQISQTIEVQVLSSPSEPVAGDVQVNTGATTTLTATGSNLNWYDSATGTTPVGTGNSFTTPVITGPVSYWVEDVLVHPGTPGNGGMTDSISGGFLNQSARYLNFDAYVDFIISSVKVYAQSAGSRTFQVLDAAGNVIATGNFTLTVGENIVPVNFTVPAGTNYSMRCTSSTVALYRDSNIATDLPYPFDLGGLGAITSSSVTGQDALNYYYYFYDWQVVTPTFTCTSPRHQINVTILGIDEIQGFSNTSLFPNPANDQVTFTTNSTINGMMDLRLFDQSGRLVKREQRLMSAGNNVWDISLNEIASGLYTAQFTINGKSAYRKLMVH